VVVELVVVDDVDVEVEVDVDVEVEVVVVVEVVVGAMVVVVVDGLGPPGPSEPQLPIRNASAQHAAADPRRARREPCIERRNYT
jgi:hypothetical protein